MADLNVHIDFKSPYTYLAIEPTRRLARELGIAIDWQPFVLDIPSYLGSARLDKGGKVTEQSRSKEQWSGVKYAYYDCRRYANLRGLTIRGTEKIWDSSLAAIGMLWAKRQGAGILDAYIDAVFEPFWRRDLDIEDIAVVRGVLAAAGADVAGFEDWAGGEGCALNEALQVRSFDSGVFGVPTYVVGQEMFFGREHLPRVRWHLSGEQGPAPDVANPLFPDDRLPACEADTLDVGFDPQDPDCLAAYDVIVALAADTGITLRWFPLTVRPPLLPPDDSDQSRGARHRRFRVANELRETARYAPDHPVDTSGIAWQAPDETADWAGAGRLGGPTFRLGEEVFAGRQHLPLIRAMRVGKAPA